MVTYRLIKDSDIVKRIEKGLISYVPNDLDNRHRVEYEEWLKAGNTPMEAD